MDSSQNNPTLYSRNVIFTINGDKNVPHSFVNFESIAEIEAAIQRRIDRLKLEYGKAVPIRWSYDISNIRPSSS